MLQCRNLQDVKISKSKFPKSKTRELSNISKNTFRTFANTICFTLTIKALDVFFYFQKNIPVINEGSRGPDLLEILEVPKMSKTLENVHKPQFAI